MASDELNSTLDRAVELMVEDGMDRNTAEAIVFGARPGQVSIRGNYADLQRSNAAEVAAEDVPDAPQLGPDATQPPLGAEAPAANEAPADEAPAVNESMTKADLLAEADRRGVTADESMTKAEIIEAINGA